MASLRRCWRKSAKLRFYWQKFDPKLKTFFDIYKKAKYIFIYIWNNIFIWRSYIYTHIQDAIRNGNVPVTPKRYIGSARCTLKTINRAGIYFSHNRAGIYFSHKFNFIIYYFWLLVRVRHFPNVIFLPPLRALDQAKSGYK